VWDEDQTAWIRRRDLPVFESNVKNYAGVGPAARRRGPCPEPPSPSAGADDDPMSSTERPPQGIDANRAALDCCPGRRRGKSCCGPYHSALGCFSGAAATPDQCALGPLESMRRSRPPAEQCGVHPRPGILNRFECYLLNTAADCRPLLPRGEIIRCRDVTHVPFAHRGEKHAGGDRATKGFDARPLSENRPQHAGTGNVRLGPETFDTLHEIRLRRPAG